MSFLVGGLNTPIYTQFRLNSGYVLSDRPLQPEPVAPDMLTLESPV
jgi:hypothetical protein